MNDFNETTPLDDKPENDGLLGKVFDFIKSGLSSDPSPDPDKKETDDSVDGEYEENRDLYSPPILSAYIEKYHFKELFNTPSFDERDKLDSERQMLWDYFFPINLDIKAIRSQQHDALNKLAERKQKKIQPISKAISKAQSGIENSKSRIHRLQQQVINQDHLIDAISAEIDNLQTMITELHRIKGSTKRPTYHAYVDLGQLFRNITKLGMEKIVSRLETHKLFRDYLIQIHEKDWDALDDNTLTNMERLLSGIAGQLQTIKSQFEKQNLSEDVQFIEGQTKELMTQEQTQDPIIVKTIVHELIQRVDAQIVTIQDEQKHWEEFIKNLSDPALMHQRVNSLMPEKLIDCAEEHLQKKKETELKYQNEKNRLSANQTKQADKRAELERKLQKLRGEQQEIEKTYERENVDIIESFQYISGLIPKPPSSTMVEARLAKDIEGIIERFKNQAAIIDDELVKISAANIFTNEEISIGNPIVLISPAELQDHNRIPYPYRPQPQTIGQKFTELRKLGFTRNSYEYFRHQVLTDEFWHLQAKRFSERDGKSAYFGVYFIEMFFILDEWMILFSLYYDFIRGQIIEERAIEIYYKEVIAIEYGKEYRPISLISHEEGAKIEYVNTDFVSIILPDGNVRTTPIPNETYYDHIRKQLGLSRLEFSSTDKFAEIQSKAEYAVRVLRKYLRDFKSSNDDHF